MAEAGKVLIGDFLKRIRRPIEIENTSEYKLLTVKLHHKGVVLRCIKKGTEIRSKKMYTVKAGDFILSGIDARNGAFGIVPDEMDGAVVTNDFWYFEVDSNIIDKKLFLELTKTSWFDDICRKGSDGTTQRIRLQKDKFFNQEIQLPLKENHDTLLKKILNTKSYGKNLSAEITHQQSLLRKLRQSILQDAISGKLTKKWRKENPDVEPASELLVRIKTEKERLIKEKKIKKQKPLPPIREDEIPFELPDGWVWCRLGETLQLTDSGWSPACKNNPAPFNKWGVLRTTSVQDLCYLQEENKELPDKLSPKPQYEVKKGDLLITRAGPANRVGICCHVKDTRKQLMISDKIIRLHPFEDYVLSAYLELCFNSKPIKLLMEEKKGGMAQSQVNISQNNLKLILIPLAPKNEQKIIYGLVEKLFTYCDSLEHQINKSQQDSCFLMQAVLKEAFEG